ncbi:MAG: hypothetical protein AAF481_18915 [Acidobacteriota bacterium]
MHTLDLIHQPLQPSTAARAATRLRSGELLQVELFDAAGAGALLDEITELQAAHLDRHVDSYSQLLVGSGGALFNWGTAEGEGAVPVVVENRPLLGTFLAAATTLAEATRQGNEEILLSVVPSVRKDRTFPRFFHRDSHSSVDEIDRDRDVPSSYRTVWDLGLERSAEVLNVHFVRRAALLDEAGRVAGEYRHLFQQQNLDFRQMSDSEIDAVQPQMREGLLPFADDIPLLRPGRAFVWTDDAYFHTTYLRADRRIEELIEQPRSILIVRQFAANAHHDIPWSEPVARLLPSVLAS